MTVCVCTAPVFQRLLWTYQLARLPCYAMWTSTLLPAATASTDRPPSDLLYKQKKTNVFFILTKHKKCFPLLLKINPRGPKINFAPALFFSRRARAYLRENFGYPSHYWPPKRSAASKSTRAKRDCVSRYLRCRPIRQGNVLGPILYLLYSVYCAEDIMNLAGSDSHERSAAVTAVCY